MAKAQAAAYVCENCGVTYAKWMGRCLECDALNSVVEKTPSLAQGELPSVVRATDVQAEVIDAPRLKSGLDFLDRLLHDGFPAGTVALLAGEPGIGKSTLLFQVLAESEGPSLYVSAEESVPQISRRFRSLKEKLPKDLFLVSEARVEAILALMQKQKPAVMVIDSIQMLVGAEARSKGSMGTLREVADLLVEEAKRLQITLWIVGHVNKDGEIAGPKTLEHLVDAVLRFSLAEDSRLRILMVQKNRYGPSSEMALLEMTERGLIEKSESDSYWMRVRREPVPGCALASILMGSRVLIVEVQALVVSTSFPSPRRSTSGFDLNRMLLLLAVLEKRLKLPFSRSDVYLNVVGGLKISDPAADLAVAAALVSAMAETAISADTVFAAEIGLTGELREPSLKYDREKAASRLGKKRFVTSMETGRKAGPTTQGFENLYGALGSLLENSSS